MTDPTQHGPTADRIAELERKIAELEAANATTPTWGAAVGARWEMIEGMRAELSRLRNRQPLSSMIDKLRAARDTRHGSELVAALRDHNAAVVNLRDSAADEIERLLHAPLPRPQDVRELLHQVRPYIESSYLFRACSAYPKTAETPQALLDAIDAALAQSDAEPFPQPRRNDGGEPCGECHIQPGETCDICGAKRQSDAQPQDVLATARKRIQLAINEIADAELIMMLRTAMSEIDLAALAQSDAHPVRSLLGDIIENYRMGIRPIGLIDEFFGFPSMTVPPRPDASGLLEAAEITEDEVDVCFEAAETAERNGATCGEYIRAALKKFTELRSPAADRKPVASGLIEAADMAHEKAMLLRDPQSSAEMFEFEDELRALVADRKPDASGMVDKIANNAALDVVMAIFGGPRPPVAEKIAPIIVAAVLRACAANRSVRPDASGLIEAAEWHERNAEKLRAIGESDSDLEADFHLDCANALRARAADRSEK